MEPSPPTTLFFMDRRPRAAHPSRGQLTQNRPMTNSPLYASAALLTGAALLAASGCSDAPPALAVGDVAFSDEEVLGLSESRLSTLREVTALGLAVDRGQVSLLGDPLVSRQEADHLWQRLQVEDILEENGIREAQLRGVYRQDPSYELTVRHLVILSERYETDARRQEAREQALEALDRVRSGEDFPTVAAQVSEEPGAAARQGLLEPGREGTWVDEFWSAAQALEEGEISDVVETPYGFHVLRLEGRRVVPFLEVRDRVAGQVAREVGTVESDATAAPLPDDWAPSDALAGAGGQLDVDALNELDPAEDADVDVLVLPGGTVRLRTLLDFAATLPPSDWGAVRDGAGNAREEAARNAARILGVRERAATRGLTVDDEWIRQRRADWRLQVNRWSGLFGFREDMGAEELRRAALDALGASGQAAELARREIHRHRGLLDRYLAESPDLAEATSA